MTPILKHRTYSPLTTGDIGGGNEHLVDGEILDKNNRSLVMRKGERVEKIFNKNHDPKGTEYHFTNEIKVLTYLAEKSYDISPRLHYTQTFRDTCVLIMDYCGIDLCDLYQLCNRKRKREHIDPVTGHRYNLSPEWWMFHVTDFCKQIKKIATILKNENILHLDYKAENFVCDLSTCKIRVIDFANSIFTTETNDMEKVKRYSIGTTLYMSPEAIFDGDRSEATDVWALATTLYVLHTGEYLPDSTYGIMRMQFDTTGKVTHPDTYRRQYDQILKHTYRKITEHYSYAPNISALAKYFVKKEERPTSFE